MKDNCFDFEQEEELDLYWGLAGFLGSWWSWIVGAVGKERPAQVRNKGSWGKGIFLVEDFNNKRCLVLFTC